MNDFINAMFELCSGIFLWLNVLELYKAKVVRGVSVWSFLVFTLWGYWNLYYYPSLNQIWSFLGGLLVVSANTVWLIMAWRYREKKNKI